MEKEKDFNLKEKRKELIKYIVFVHSLSKEQALAIIEEIEEQDKEFIRRLKKGRPSFNGRDVPLTIRNLNIWINELSGFEE